MQTENEEQYRNLNPGELKLLFSKIDSTVHFKVVNSFCVFIYFTITYFAYKMENYLNQTWLGRLALVNKSADNEEILFKSFNELIASYLLLTKRCRNFIIY